MVVFGTQNPFYVVVSESMVPELLVYDVLVVQGHAPFEEVAVGDVIVFDRPSDHERVIVHRVASIIDDDPLTLRAKGDANSSSIPGTDYPITDEEYIGTVAYVIPQIGFVTQILKPPTNYIIIAVVIGIMIAKQVLKNKKDSDKSILGQKDDAGDRLSGPPDDLFELDSAEPDSEYSTHAGKHESKDMPAPEKKDTDETDENPVPPK